MALTRTLQRLVLRPVACSLGALQKRLTTWDWSWYSSQHDEIQTHEFLLNNTIPVTRLWCVLVSSPAGIFFFVLGMTDRGLEL